MTLPSSALTMGALLPHPLHFAVLCVVCCINAQVYAASMLLITYDILLIDHNCCFVDTKWQKELILCSPDTLK